MCWETTEAVACLLDKDMIKKIRGSDICIHLQHEFLLFLLLVRAFELIKRKTESLLQDLCLGQLGSSAI